MREEEKVVLVIFMIITIYLIANLNRNNTKGE